MALFLSGCETVTSLELVGRSALQLEKEQWQGTWLVENGAVHVKVIDAGNGELRLYIVDVDTEAADKVVQSYKVYARKSGNTYYMNLLDTDPSVEGYFFAKFKRDNNQIQLWSPANMPIHKAIKSGLVAGKANQDASNIVLQATPQALDKYFAANPDAFDAKPIWVMSRITGKTGSP